MVKLSLIERREQFWATVDRSAGPNSCWTRPISAGHRYSQFWDGDRQRNISGHRLAWEFTYGPVLHGLKVLHSCDNPPCCNPAHLFLGTSLANSRDMVTKGRQARGEHNGLAQLTTDRVLEIRRLREPGLLLKEIAEHMWVAIPTVHHVLTGKTWSHV